MFDQWIFCLNMFNSLPFQFAKYWEWFTAYEWHCHDIKVGNDIQIVVFCDVQ